MSTLQTNYPETLAAGYAGMVANGETSNRITRTLGVAAVAFGAALFQATEQHDCTTAQDEEQFLGFAIATVGQGLVGGQTADQYRQYDNVPIFTKGAIFVDLSTAATIGDKIYLTAGGLLTNVVGANLELVGWLADQTIGAAGICRIAKR